MLRAVFAAAAAAIVVVFGFTSPMFSQKCLSDCFQHGLGFMVVSEKIPEVNYSTQRCEREGG